MKTERNILIAFILNLGFAIFELFGGLFTGSVAILSDALHDVGDALSIGISYFLERKSKRKPDHRYTYGYLRYSVIGGVITTLILLVGSVLVVIGATKRIISPTEINYNGMIVFALVGVCVNLCAAFFTREGGSINQRAVNLHMLEDVLGWAVVLAGAVVMRFTDFVLLDPIMSIGVAVFILIGACRNLGEALEVFLEKTPHGMDLSEIVEHISHVEGVAGVHHVHVWSMDGEHHYATMHLVIEGDAHEIKEKVREELHEHGITHATLETELDGEHCDAEECRIACDGHAGHHHHHHH